MGSTIVKRYYCTYFDSNYLIKGLALIESLNRHEKNGLTIGDCIEKWQECTDGLSGGNGIKFSEKTEVEAMGLLC